MAEKQAGAIQKKPRIIVCNLILTILLDLLLRRSIEMNLWFFFLIFIFCNAIAENAREIRSATTKMQCGNSEVTVVTICGAEMLGGFPSCQEQDFIFYNNEKPFKIKAAGFLIKANKSEPRLLDYVASDWACQASPDGNYIVVRYYNGGNCLECELHMIYNLQGKVLTDRNNKSFNAIHTKMRLQRLGKMQKIRIPFDVD